VEKKRTFLQKPGTGYNRGEVERPFAFPQQEVRSQNQKEGNPQQVSLLKKEKGKKPRDTCGVGNIRGMNSKKLSERMGHNGKTPR